MGREKVRQSFDLVECWWDRERERREEGVAEWRQRERESRKRGGESVVCATERERRNQAVREQRLGKLQLLEKRRKRDQKS